MKTTTELLEKEYGRELFWEQCFAHSKQLCRGTLKIVSGLCCAIFESHPLYKFNEETGRYEEFNPRMDTPNTYPPKIF